MNDSDDLTKKSYQGFSALILGGANSGKTACSLVWAKGLARGEFAQKGFTQESGKQEKNAAANLPTYIATYIATAKYSEEDTSLAARIKKHQAERGDDFITLEQPEPLKLVSSLRGCESRVIVVDCLTLFLSALLFREGQERMSEQGDVFSRELEALEAFLHSIAGSDKSVLFVSNEVGLGIVPYTKMGEVFRGFAGILHQRIAACVSVLALVVAGVPMLIKGSVPNFTED